jgi:predicted transcriptional regulator
MSKSKSLSDEKLLTEVELELMTILWKLGEGSVAQVLEGLPNDRQLAYTSVSTILRILEQKDVLQTRKEGRGHIYIPVLKKQDYEAKTLRRVVERVFDNTPVALVKQLLSTGELSAQDIAELKNLLNKKDGGR